MSLTAAQLKLCALLLGGAAVGSVSTVAVQKAPTSHKRAANVKKSAVSHIRPAQPVSPGYKLPPAPSMALLTECPLPSAVPSFSDSEPLPPMTGALGGVELGSTAGGVVTPFLPGGSTPPPFIPAPAVTEPPAWALSILGFGLMGTALRRKKRETNHHCR